MIVIYDVDDANEPNKGVPDGVRPANKVWIDDKHMWIYGKYCKMQIFICIWRIVKTYPQGQGLVSYNIGYWHW